MRSNSLTIIIIIIIIIIAVVTLVDFVEIIIIIIIQLSHHSLEIKPFETVKKRHIIFLVLPSLLLLRFLRCLPFSIKFCHLKWQDFSSRPFFVSSSLTASSSTPFFLSEKQHSDKHRVTTDNVSLCFTPLILFFFQFFFTLLSVYVSYSLVFSTRPLSSPLFISQYFCLNSCLPLFFPFLIICILFIMKHTDPAVQPVIPNI